MKIVAVIPSRYGSTRFPGKPLAEICGIPLIQRVYENCMKSGAVDAVVVATDDQRIADAVSGFGGRFMMTGEENRSGSDRAAETGRKLGLSDEDIIVNVQGDQPLVHPDCIRDVIQPLLEDRTLDMSTLVFKIVDEREITDPKDVKTVFDNNGMALYFSRATIPFPRDPGTKCDFYKHLGVYAYSMKFLESFCKLPEGILENIEKLEQLRAIEYGYKIKTVITEHDSPEVDLPEDIVRIEKILS
ncbi:3-deoxy-manno-octulosonate cytidylyltransferase [Desulforegula conservatrix]|uniref:3-deoxy-manno-octulosonate cytidylyltransferase n=1 Tax=Desulforegula conservatrix TaxID=153026 RepID=UPI00041BCA67|nr:3-deoxy-manno-octulosonate cytidylyltransferase [Desulforegula conservatrix]